MASISDRQLNSGIVICVIGLMGYGLYTEYVDGLIPCPLCMTQRIFFCLIGGLALIAAVHNPASIGRRIYAVLTGLLRREALPPPAARSGCSTCRRIRCPPAGQAWSTCWKRSPLPKPSK